jgi:hypothetical protein
VNKHQRQSETITANGGKFHLPIGASAFPGRRLKIICIAATPSANVKMRWRHRPTALAKLQTTPIHMWKARVPLHFHEILFRFLHQLLARDLSRVETPGFKAIQHYNFKQLTTGYK